MAGIKGMRKGLYLVCSRTGCGKPAKARGFCATHHVAWLRKQNPEKARAQGAAYRLKNYNLTQGQFDAIFDAQGRRCAICKSKSRRTKHDWHIDHDHACCPRPAHSCGRCIRGILCGPCNSMLGNADDNTETLRDAADYLEDYVGRKVGEVMEQLFPGEIQQAA